MPARIHSLGPSTEKPDDLDSAGLSQCVLRSLFQASLQRNCFILKQSIFFGIVEIHLKPKMYVAWLCIIIHFD